MLRSPAVLLVMMALPACSVLEGAQTWGEHTECSAESLKGHLATRTWCDTEWRTWHAEGQAASAGRVVDGVHLPAHTMWWSNGQVAGRIDGTTMRVYDENGVEQKVGVGVVREDGRLALACPENTESHEKIEEGGHRRSWCGSADGTVHGRMVTYYPDGSVESVQTYVDGVRHGPFEAYHVGGPKEPGPEQSIGPLWIRGAHANDKKHGPWLKFDAAGHVYQASIEPEWQDHTPVDTWIRRSVTADE